MHIHACMRTHINVHMKTHVHAPKCPYSHACTHICMHACTCRYIKKFIYLHSYTKTKASALYDIEFRESDVSPGRTEVKQGKFVEYIFPAKGYFRETNIGHGPGGVTMHPPKGSPGVVLYCSLDPPD